MHFFIFYFLPPKLRNYFHKKKSFSVKKQNKGLQTELQPLI